MFLASLEKVIVCKHQLWVMLYILQVPEEDPTLHQVAFTNAELTVILKGAEQFHHQPTNLAGRSQHPRPNPTNLAGRSQHPRPNPTNLAGRSQHPRPNPTNLAGRSQHPRPNPTNLAGRSQHPRPNPSNLAGSSQHPRPNPTNLAGSSQHPRPQPTNRAGSSQHSSVPHILILLLYQTMPSQRNKYFNKMHAYLKFGN